MGCIDIFMHRALYIQSKSNRQLCACNYMGKSKPSQWFFRQGYQSRTPRWFSARCGVRWKAIPCIYWKFDGVDFGVHVINPKSAGLMACLLGLRRVLLRNPNEGYRSRRPCQFSTRCGGPSKAFPLHILGLILPR